MTDYFGSCLCGTVRFEVKGDFDSFYLCHCQHCQKDTGSAHAANLFSQSAKLIWQSGTDAVNSFTKKMGLKPRPSRAAFCSFLWVLGFYYPPKRKNIVLSSYNENAQVQALQSQTEPISQADN